MTKIDDEMVTRAYAKACAIGQSLTLDEDGVRAILEAALSPKPEPEIEVTEGMKQAGTLAMNRHTHDAPGIGWTVHFQNFAKAAVDIYRAMESTRLKEAQERNPFGVRLYWDKNDRRQRGQIVMNDRRVGDRRGRDRFAKDNRQKFYGMTRD